MHELNEKAKPYDRLYDVQNKFFIMQADYHACTLPQEFPIF